MADTGGEVDRGRHMTIEEDARRSISVESPDHSYERGGKTEMREGGEEEVTAKGIIGLLEIYREEQARDIRAVCQLLNI